MYKRQGFLVTGEGLNSGLGAGPFTTVHNNSINIVSKWTFVPFSIKRHTLMALIDVDFSILEFLNVHSERVHTSVLLIVSNPSV